NHSLLILMDSSFQVLSSSQSSSQLWLLLSHSYSDIKVVIKMEEDEYPVDEMSIHEKVVILTIPTLPLSEDTTVTIILSAESQSTSHSILYKAEKPSIPSLPSPLIDFSTRSDPLVLIEAFSSQISLTDEEGNKLEHYFVFLFVIHCPWNPFYSCLHISARNSQNYAIKLLLCALQKEREAVRRDAVNKRNERGETPLHLAVKSNDADAVHYLLSAGAQITLTDRFDNSILHYLAESHNDDIYKEVLERSLDISHFEAKNNEGLNPLHLAVRRLKLSLIETILEVSPNSIDLRDSNGRTALLHSIEMNDHEIVAFLLSKGADANVEDEPGMNALLLSNKVGNYVIMGQLLDAGADAYKETKNGEKLADSDDEMVVKIIGGERTAQVFKVVENDGIEQRRGELFGHSSHGGPLVEELDELDDEPGPSTSRERGRRTGLSLGNDDVSCLDYLTRLRLSKVLDLQSKWEVLARELECEHMIELISICSHDSSPTMILLDQFEQLPEASITRVRGALERIGLEEGVKLIDERMVY
ncbi:ikb-1, partial [Pristionchus pacificus]